MGSGHCWGRGWLLRGAWRWLLLGALVAASLCANAQAAGAATLSVSDCPAVDVTAPNPTAVFTVTLSQASSGPVSVAYQAANETATSPQNYIAPPANSTLTFQPGQTALAVDIPVVNDNRNDPDETFELVLSSPAPSGVTISRAVGQCTILAHGTPPTVNVADAVVQGGVNTTGANRLVVFNVSLSAPSGKTITLAYATQDGTGPNAATVGNGDYTENDGQLQFPPGTTSEQVSVSVVGDSLDLDEWFNLVICGDPGQPPPAGCAGQSPPTNATLGRSRAVGSIVAGGPNASIAPVTVTQGATGTTTTAAVTVTLDNASPQDAGFTVSTADGSASAPADYVAIQGQRLVIPAGQKTGTVHVTINGNSTSEPDKTFAVSLGSPSHAQLTTGTAVVTIHNAAPSPSILASNTSVAQGAGVPTTAKVNVSLSAPSGRSLSAAYSTADGTAVAGSDYISTSGTLTFSPGTTSQQISIPILYDTTVEEDPSFTLTIQNTAAGAAPVSVIVTILENNLTASVEPALTVGDATVHVGSGGTLFAVFQVSLDRALARHVSAAYATSDGTAVAPRDYTPASGTLTLAPGQTQATISVPVSVEPTLVFSKTFTLTLSDPVDATLARAAGVGILIGDFAGGGPVSVPSTPLLASALLCRHGHRCAGLPVSWSVASPGSMAVAVSTTLPRSGHGKPTTVTLVARTYRTRPPGSSVRIELAAGHAATQLLRRLHAARVKSVSVLLTFTNQLGAQQEWHFTVPLRS